MNAVDTIFRYRGFHGCESMCGLRVVPLRDGRVVVICSELPDNPGTSVTNFVEQLAALVCQNHGIRPEKLLWIEHYVPHRGHPNSEWDLVTFTVALGDERHSVFSAPKWRRMKDADWTALGLPLPETD